MKTALICVLIAGLMPYLWTTVAKIAGQRYDNRNVREWQSKLSGFAQRAHAAHLNSFEAFPFFSAAVLSALLTNVDQEFVAQAAIAFIVVRVLYGVAYLADLPRSRSLVWFLALACVIALLVQSIRAVG